MASAHTPGPWVVYEGEAAGHHIVGTAYVVEPYGATVGFAVVRSWDGVPSDAERDANANLIAAAPDLLAALKATARCTFSDYGPCWCPDNQRHTDACRAANAALAKAESRA